MDTSSRHTLHVCMHTRPFSSSAAPAAGGATATTGAAAAAAAAAAATAEELFGAGTEQAGGGCRSGLVPSVGATMSPDGGGLRTLQLIMKMMMVMMMLLPLFVIAFTCSLGVPEAVVGTLLQGVLPPAGLGRAAAPPATPEDGQEALAEPLVHETVRDWVAARRHVGQQVDEVHDKWRHVTHGSELVKDVPRLQDVRRSPAHKELEHDHEQHLDDPFLGSQAALRVVLADASLVVLALHQARATSVGISVPTDDTVAVATVLIRVEFFLGLALLQTPHLWKKP